MGSPPAPSVISSAISHCRLTTSRRGSYLRFAPCRFVPDSPRGSGNEYAPGVRGSPGDSNPNAEPSTKKTSCQNQTAERIPSRGLPRLCSRSDRSSDFRPHFRRQRRGSFTPPPGPDRIKHALPSDFEISLTDRNIAVAQCIPQNHDVLS